MVLSEEDHILKASSPGVIARALFLYTFLGLNGAYIKSLFYIIAVCMY